MIKNILVTGCAGFIGSSVCKSLKKNYKIYGFDDFSTGSKKNIIKEINLINHKKFNQRKILKSKIKYDAIIHCAGQSSGEKSFWNPNDDHKRNFILTKNMVDFAAQNRIRKFIFTSSMSVYGDVNGMAKTSLNCSPKSFYGLNKLLSEKYISYFHNKIDFTILRLFNVYGPGQNLKIDYQGMVSIFLADLIKNNKISVKGSFKRYRDFIYIDDVVDIIKNSIRNKKLSNKIINLGTSKKTTLLRLINELCKIHLKKKRKKTIIQSLGSTPGDQFGIYSDKKIFEIKNSFTTLKKGLSKFYEYAVREIN